MAQQTGWKSIPTALKILFVFITLWILGSITGLPMRYEQGLPFMGFYLYGLSASLVVLLLDIIGPLAFLTGLWKRMSWAPKVAYTYNGVFILNSIIALLLFREQLGIVQILIPTTVSIIFVSVIYAKRNYLALA